MELAGSLDGKTYACVTDDEAFPAVVTSKGPLHIAAIQANCRRKMRNETGKLVGPSM
jgi:hypothetical protein